jgi:hypothetical protein
MTACWRIKARYYAPSRFVTRDDSERSWAAWRSPRSLLWKRLKLAGISPVGAKFAPLFAQFVTHHAAGHCAADRARGTVVCEFVAGDPADGSSTERAAAEQH